MTRDRSRELVVGAGEPSRVDPQGKSMQCHDEWTITAITEDIVRGALELEHTGRGTLPHRLPAWARALCTDGQLAMVESQPSGVRLVFRTAATTIELDTVPTRLVYLGAPPRPDGIYDLRIDG